MFAALWAAEELYAAVGAMEEPGITIVELCAARELGELFPKLCAAEELARRVLVIAAMVDVTRAEIVDVAEDTAGGT